MKIDELLVHRAIASNPELLESKLGIKLDKDSLQHHYPLSNKGEHIDFVFKDISGTTYLAEVKLGVSPISVIPQLYDHEYKKFIAINDDLDQNRIIPVIVTDNESVTDQDIAILSRMNIKLCTYDLDEIQSVLPSTPEPIVPFEFPDLSGIEAYLDEARALRENFGDVNFLLEGFRGKTWWDGYYDFRTFWLWKEDNYPGIHQKIFQLLCEGRKEDCIWFTFITAISDNLDVAKFMVFDENWGWSQVLSARRDKTKWEKFENCLCNSGKWCIQALLDYGKRKQVISDYLEKVGDSQERYFLQVMSKSNNPFDAYNQVRESIYEIRNIGNVVAGEFATYISQWRILPIIPSDRVRESKFVRKALDSLGIRQPMESYRDALLRLAKKYSVAPIVMERAMHKLGRISGDQ
jgi:hypothetical protein